MNYVTIIGAGMAGLLAAIMLRREAREIWEQKGSLPNNHNALLRFRSAAVADATGIPFKKVRVMKATLPWNNPVADAISYSMKVTGEASIRSISSAEGLVETRYIAPPDLINQMAAILPCPIIYGKSVQHWHLNTEHSPVTAVEPIISTIPMPRLMALLHYPHMGDFAWRTSQIRNINARIMGIGEGLYATLYVPNPSYPMHRISMTGNLLQIEMMEVPSQVVEPEDVCISMAMSLLGIHVDGVKVSIGERSTSIQPYGKITEVDDGARKRFIMWATDNYNIYSLGRFATWRPGLLLDDVVDDVKAIHDMIRHGRYHRRIIKSNRD